jgi:Ricin-type beta-trefoil lectin domain
MLKRRFGWGIGIAIPVVLMSATVLMAAAVPASASSNTIVTYNGKCLTDGGSTAKSAPITQYKCNGNTKAQTWTGIDDLGAIEYENLSGMCLTDGGSTANSAPITQYPCNNSPNQLWTLVQDTNSNYVSIKNLNDPHMCMTNGGSTANSAKITQYTCASPPSDTNQWFTVN